MYTITAGLWSIIAINVIRNKKGQKEEPKPEEKKYNNKLMY